MRETKIIRLGWFRNVKIGRDACCEATGTAQFYGNVIVDAKLDVSGNINFANPYWVAVTINDSGGNPVIVRNGGRNPATSLIRVSGQAAGYIQFDFPAHPQETNYRISASCSAGYPTLGTTLRTSTRIAITTRNIADALFDTELHVHVLAY
jgi:hypothetical protein